MRHLLLLAAVLLTAVPVSAQSTVNTEASNELAALAEKYVGLAAALDDPHYAWRPAEGVRSTSEVLNHVAGSSYLLAGFIGCQAPSGADAPADFGASAEYEKAADRAVIGQRLEDAFAFLSDCFDAVPAETIAGPLSYFGNEGTGRSFVFFMNGHLHEHLGQLIAYARVNGVVPPWSN